ncbi:ParA family protein [Aciditerrimonas ferrireducens]|uniref:ParA family protein n=1 Tax=Aciditerrimonas ferrireducens TaxID=667306 RepID=A0ABV6BZT4_9ACTN
MTWVIWNGKGGCGKTTTAVGLAGELATRGTPVTLIDLDSQTNATTWLLSELPDGPGALELLTGRATLDEASYPVPGLEALRVVPASPRLARIAVELEDDPVPQLALRRAISDTTSTIVLDTPPAFGELPVMALAAATRHVVPLRPAALDLDAAQQSLRRADAVRTQLNPDLRLAGFVLCAYDARTTVAAATEQALKRAYPDLPVIRIPAAVAVTMAPGAHQLITDYAPLSPAALATEHAALTLTGAAK